MPERLELATEFYPLEVIERAAAAFAHAATVTVEAGAERHRVLLVPHAPSARSLAPEFANWVLAAGIDGQGAEAAAPAAP